MTEFSIFCALIIASSFAYLIGYTNGHKRAAAVLSGQYIKLIVEFLKKNPGNSEAFLKHSLEELGIDSQKANWMAHNISKKQTEMGSEKV